MPSNESSPSDRNGSSEKKPFQDNCSPPSVMPVKAYKFLLPESVLKSRRVISIGPIVRSKGTRGVRSVNENDSPRFQNGLRQQEFICFHRHHRWRRTVILEGLLLAGSVPVRRRDFVRWNFPD